MHFLKFVNCDFALLMISINHIATIWHEKLTVIKFYSLSVCYSDQKLTDAKFMEVKACLNTCMGEAKNSINAWALIDLLIEMDSSTVDYLSVHGISCE